jgi:magnesium chelatase subunit I
MTIASLENLVSNIERRALLNGEQRAFPRVSDLLFVTPAMTGKMELVYEGEQEGPLKVARAVIGLAVRTLFARYCPPLDKKTSRKEEAIPVKGPYDRIVRHFEEGGEVRIETQSAFDAYWNSLNAVPGLRDFVEKHLPASDGSPREEAAFKMEFVLEGLHFNSRLSKSVQGAVTRYGDMIASMMGQASG